MLVAPIFTQGRANPLIGAPYPYAPSAVTPANTGSGEVTVEWVDNSTNEHGFEIERSTDGVTYAPVGTAAENATAFVDSGVAPGAYYYRVRSERGPAFPSDWATSDDPLLVP